ncbi:MAG: YggT family protein [Asticcacaulis sp.]
MSGFIFSILTAIFNLLVWAIIISAVLSWLVAFNVINTRNPFVYQVMRTLDALTYPLLEPFRRFIPNLGGIDISPIIAIIVIQAMITHLFPIGHQALSQLIG